jgi:hypothetical protein
MKVLINCKEHEFTEGERLSYETIVSLVGYDPKSVITVTYARGNTCGSLTFGQAIGVVEGLKVDAIRTGNA